ncbi:MAG: leucine-rich repeat domain-containing protein [Vicingaceae bacterium]
MKKIVLTFITVSTFGFGGMAQNVNVPDANFKAYLVGNSSINTNADTSIQVSEANAFTGQINCSSLNISDLTGIEAFTSLTDLRFNNNSITNVNLNNNVSLTNLECLNNQLTSLDLTQNINMTRVVCRINQLTSLDLSQNIAMENFYCQNNQLTSLDVNNNINLLRLYCEGNQLTSLDVSNNTLLTRLLCNNNLLQNLNAANGNNINISTAYFKTQNNPSLTCIQVDDSTYSANNWTNIDAQSYYSVTACPCFVYIPDANFKAYLIGNSSINTNADTEIQCSEAAAFTGQINCSSLNISDLTGIEAFTSLTILKCNSNQLTTLDLSNNTDLIEVQCSDNAIALINLTQNTLLTDLKCNVNQIANLDLSQNTQLLTLQCNLNMFSSLDLSNNTALTNVLCSFHPNLASLNVSQNPNLTQLYCFDNQLTNLDVSNNPMLTQFRCNDNQLTTLNVANGNNVNVTNANFHAQNNPNLNCIQVDDSTYSANNWTNIDTGVSFSMSACPCNINVHIPDTNFKAYLVGNLAINTNADTEIQCTEAAAFSGGIICSSLNITDLTGIEHFTSIVSLRCFNNNLTSLDVTQNIALQQIRCYQNQLNSLDVTQNTLLTYLSCDNNNLDSINVTNNTALTYLSCRNNSLTSLDMSNNTDLEELDCSYNQLTSLDVSNSTVLEELDCSSNNLSNIDVSNNIDLFYLYCNHNQLTNIDVLTNTTLYELRCENNQLTSLDFSLSPVLEYLTCDSNQLVNLNVANGNNITTFVFHFSSTGNPSLTCIQVDDSTYSANNWTDIDPQNYFSVSSCPILVDSVFVQGQGGVNTINVPSGTLQMEAAVLPLNADNNTYSWSIANGTGSASIDVSGFVTAITDGTVFVTATANDASGTVGNDTITISNQTTGIAEQGLENSLTIYPNPNNGTFSLAIKKEAIGGTINVLNPLGQLVFSKNITQQKTTVNIPNLTKGIYFVKVLPLGITQKILID